MFAFVDAYLIHARSGMWLALVCCVAFVAFQYLFTPWLIASILRTTWHDPKSALSPASGEFVELACAERKIPVPRIGIIDKPAPYALSFGCLPCDARVVVTKGVLNSLSSDEANALITHELRRIEQCDFAVLTIASLVPLLVYQTYVFGRHLMNARLVGLGAYAFYWFSQIVFLSLNSLREYHPDHTPFF